MSYTVDNTTRDAAWVKCKGPAFLQGNSNSDGTFLRGLFAWSNAEPNKILLGQDTINLKRTTQRSVTQQHNVPHSTVALRLVGMRWQVEMHGSQAWNSPVATGALVVLARPSKASSPPNWNIKQYLSVEYVSMIRVSSPPAPT